MKRSIILIFIAVFFIMTISTSYARIIFTPVISVKEEYNDNIFLTEDDREDDFITTVSPHIALEYSPNSKLDLSLNYGLNFRFYGYHNEFNDTSLRETQSIQFDAKARPFSRVYLDITDTYDRVGIDQRRRTSEDNAFFNKTDRNVFTISPHTIIPVTPSASVTAGYEYINTWHKESEATDSDSHSLFGSLEKRFTSKLNGSLTYRFTNYRPHTSDNQTGVNDYDRHTGTVGVTYKLSSKIELGGEVGQSYLNSKEQNDADSFIWSVKGAYNQEAEGALSATVTYGRSFENSITNGVSEREQADLIVAFGRTYKISINPYYRGDKFVNVERKDSVAGISTTVSRSVSQKMTMSVNGSFEHQKFSPEDDKVKRYSAGTSVDYQIRKNVIAGVGYSFSKRDSSKNADNYDNNIVWIRGAIEL